MVRIFVQTIFSTAEYLVSYSGPLVSISMLDAL